MNVSTKVIVTLAIISYPITSFAQIDPNSFNHYLTYQDKVTDQVVGSDNQNESVFTAGFLKQINSNGNKLEGFKFFYGDDTGDPTRQIKNASKLYKENSQSVLLLVSPDYESFGAGCIISEDGYVVTNYHVAENYDRLLTFFYDENVTSLQDLDAEKFKVASIIAALPEKDLALLKLSSNSKFKTLRYGNNSRIEIAQDVFAIGHPESYIWSFTYGVISQLRNKYEWDYGGRNKCRANVIQTQTPINPGNSGGPLFNDKGELIGINTFGYGNAEGLNFAIRIDEIEKFVNESKRGKYKYELKAVASSREAEIYWDLIDSNENGINDCEAADMNSNGQYDVIRVDEDEDGYVDFIILDSNEDGEVDVYIYDEDDDGYFEYFIIDTNYDRKFDTVGIDTNQDGYPNEFYDYVG
jgi:S1-C subfamily serine protease